MIVSAIIGRLKVGWGGFQEAVFENPTFLGGFGTPKNRKITVQFAIFLRLRRIFLFIFRHFSPFCAAGKKFVIFGRYFL